MATGRLFQEILLVLAGSGGSVNARGVAVQEEESRDARIRPKPNYAANQKESITEYVVLLVVFLLVAPEPEHVGATRDLPASYARYFRALGHKIRSYRTARKLSQEDMISYGFSVRHWQMMEAGRPITMFTLLRVCEAFEMTPEQLVAGLSRHLGKRSKMERS